ncbi:MAG: hypothetical protein COB81_11205 [Flavobacteriaceae bacterium]|nr:MAG: hypothetical protein COB81_11205 [Flavobacteriaceae bacterium]
MKCPHSELTLVVDEAFDIYEKTHVACAGCGEPIKQIENRKYRRLIWKTILIGLVLFFVIGCLTAAAISEVLKSLIKQ